MRIYSLILSLFIISQSLIPCCAVTLNSQISIEVNIQKTCCESHPKEDQKSEKENKCHGVCSPFFSCCSSVVPEISDALHLNFNLSEIEKLGFPLIDEKFNSFYFNNLWQPPKI